MATNRKLTVGGALVALTLAIGAAYASGALNSGPCLHLHGVAALGYLDA